MLINCPKCGKRVSDKAELCPQCGYPVSEMIAQISLDLPASTEQKNEMIETKANSLEVHYDAGRSSDESKLHDKASSKKILKIIGTASAIIAIIGLTIWGAIKMIHYSFGTTPIENDQTAKVDNIDKPLVDQKVATEDKTIVADNNDSDNDNEQITSIISDSADEGKDNASVESVLENNLNQKKDDALEAFWDDNYIEIDLSDYIIYESDSWYLSESDLYGLSTEECRLARNEIYARHGRQFKTDNLKEYFNACSWYYGGIPADDFDENAILNAAELANISLIKDYENAGKPKLYENREREDRIKKAVQFGVNYGAESSYSVEFRFTDMNNGYVIIDIDLDMDGRFIYYYYFTIDDSLKVTFIDPETNSTSRFGYINPNNGPNGKTYNLNFYQGSWGYDILDYYLPPELYEMNHYRTNYFAP